MWLYLLCFILSFIEVWVLIEAGKADRRSNKIGSGLIDIVISALWEVGVESILFITGLLIYAEDHKLTIPAVYGAFLGTVFNKGYDQFKFKKNRFQPKPKLEEEDDDV